MTTTKILMTVLLIGLLVYTTFTRVLSTEIQEKKKDLVLVPVQSCSKRGVVLHVLLLIFCEYAST